VRNSDNDLKKIKFKTLDEFYTKNVNEDGISTMSGGIGDENDYVVSYKALNKETFVTIIIAQSMPSDVMIFAEYGKYKTGWQLNVLLFGQYKLLNKTASQYYDVAKQVYEKENRIDASLSMITASEIGQPAGDFLRYKNYDEMKTFYKKVINETNLKYHFPVTVPQIETLPQIFTVRPQIIVDGAFNAIVPVVEYKTSISLTDTIKLKSENSAMQKLIGNIFNSGFTANKKTILYRAYSEIPDSTNNFVEHYGFVQHLK